MTHVAHRRAARRGSKSFRVVRAGLRRADRRAHRARRSRRRARRRRGRRSRRLCGGQSCGAGSTSCRCRPRCWRRSIPRSAARPASIRATARIWSAPSISRSWWSPTPALLDTLPQREFRAGYAEVAKYGLLGDAGFLRLARGELAGRVRRRPGARARDRGRLPRQGRDRGARRARDRRARAAQSRPHLRPCASRRRPAFPTRLLHGEAVAIGMALRVRILGPARPAAAGRCRRACRAILRRSACRPASSDVPARAAPTPTR